MNILDKPKKVMSAREMQKAWNNLFKPKNNNMITEELKEAMKQAAKAVKVAQMQKMVNDIAEIKAMLKEPKNSNFNHAGIVIPKSIHVKEFRIFIEETKTECKSLIEIATEYVEYLKSKNK